ncbi:MAG: biotin-dependent carboxyltransferase family protein [Pedobacter sp.]
MQITIVKPGIFTTVQDLGRVAYLGQGVPLSGAMDRTSCILSNLAVGNTENEATLEFTYANAAFTADTDLMISYCGYGATLSINNMLIPSVRPIFIPKGSTVKLENNTTGTRTYVAIAGGWELPEIMGSKSTYITGNFGGFKGRSLLKGDVLTSGNPMTSTSEKIFSDLSKVNPNYPSWYITHRIPKPYNDTIQLRIVPGPEFSWFDSDSILSFFSETYTIGRNGNRMGLNLKGKKIIRKGIAELLSTAVAPGTIQVSGDGSIIILMSDCQTIGGYPRIAQVAAVDLSICGQLKPDDKIEFIAISKEEAEILYLDQRKDFTKIAASIAIKY